MYIDGFWVHQLDPVLLRFHGDFGIRWYGLAYLAAFAIAYGLLSLMRKKNRITMTADQQSALFTWLIMGVLLGGRVGYVVLYAWHDFIQQPWMVFQVWQGGMASHGGFVGVIVAIWMFSRKHKIPLFRLGDALAVMTPPGLMLGRIANFINGELWGTPSRVPWAVIFPGSAPIHTPLNQIPPRHPSQLYEAGLEGAFLSVYMLWRMFGSKRPPAAGRIGGEFLILYGAVRVVGEQFREPDAALIMGMSRGIFYSLFLILGGIILIGYVHTHSREDAEYDR